MSKSLIMRRVMSKRLFCLVVFIWYALFSVNASDQIQIVLPNPDSLGKDVKNNLIPLESTAETGLAPIELRMIMKNGEVQEVQAFYEKSINIDQIAMAVSADTNNTENVTLRSSKFRCWWNQSAKIQIQLREYYGEKIMMEDDIGPVLHDGEKLLIFIRSNKKSSVPVIK
jgi:hypothetical protein